MIMFSEVFRARSIHFFFLSSTFRRRPYIPSTLSTISSNNYTNQQQRRISICQQSKPIARSIHHSYSMHLLLSGDLWNELLQHPDSGVGSFDKGIIRRKQYRRHCNIFQKLFVATLKCFRASFKVHQVNVSIELQK